MSHLCDIVLHCGCRITVTLHRLTSKRDSLGYGCDGSQSPLLAHKHDREDVDVFKPSTPDNDVII